MVNRPEKHLSHWKDSFQDVKITGHNSERGYNTAISCFVLLFLLSSCLPNLKLHYRNTHTRYGLLSRTLTLIFTIGQWRLMGATYTWCSVIYSAHILLNNRGGQCSGGMWNMVENCHVFTVAPSSKRIFTLLGTFVSLVSHYADWCILTGKLTNAYWSKENFRCLRKVTTWNTYHFIQL